MGRAWGYGRTDRAVTVAGLVLLAFGALGAVFGPLNGRPLGLLFALPLAFALGLITVGWLRRRQGGASPIAAGIGLDGVIFLLGVGVLAALLALTVYFRSESSSLAAKITAHGTATATDCRRQPWIGWTGVGGSWTCTATVTWDGQTFTTVRFPHSQLTPADIDAAVPVLAERSWYGGNQVVRDDGHPWALAGLLISLPVGLFAAVLVLSMVFVALRPIPPPGSGLPAAAESPDDVEGPEGTMVTAAVAVRRIRDQRGPVSVDDVREAPAWVVTPEIRRTRIAGVVLLITGVLSALLAWLGDVRFAVGVTVLLAGLLVWGWSGRAQWRRLLEAARIQRHGPDVVDALQSIRERARGRRRPLVLLVAVVFAVCGLVLLVALYRAWPAPLPMLSNILATVGLLAAAVLLAWPVRRVDRQWRARLCRYLESPAPSVPAILVPLLNERERAMAGAAPPNE